MMDFGRVAFVGNCQIAAMWLLYTRVLPRELAGQAVYIPAYNAATPESRRAIAEADRVVWQLTEFAQELGNVESSAPRFLVPLCICPFLWPYAGDAHPRNVALPCLPDGPYPGEFGDSFLNQLIDSGTEPDAAAQRYLALDVARIRSVGRMAEIALDQQRRRDRACGYDVAGVIDRLLARQPLFRSRGHLNPPIMRHLAETLFARMGADAEFMRYVATTRYDDLVPYSEIPVHPSVAAHFGLAYVAPDTRYQFFYEGGFTFAEWAARYIRCNWNQDFAQAMHLAQMGNTDLAIPLWEQSMAQSPRSSIGRASLAEVMVQSGRAGHAVRWIRDAAQLEPDNADYARRSREITAQASHEAATATAADKQAN